MATDIINGTSTGIGNVIVRNKTANSIPYDIDKANTDILYLPDLFSLIFMKKHLSALLFLCLFYIFTIGSHNFKLILSCKVFFARIYLKCYQNVIIICLLVDSADCGCLHIPCICRHYHCYWQDMYSIVIGRFNCINTGIVSS